MSPRSAATTAAAVVDIPADARGAPHAGTVLLCDQPGFIGAAPELGGKSDPPQAMQPRSRLKFLSDLHTEIQAAAKVMRFQSVLLDIPGDEMDLVNLCQVLLGRALEIVKSATSGRLFLVGRVRFDCADIARWRRTS